MCGIKYVDHQQKYKRTSHFPLFVFVIGRHLIICVPETFNKRLKFSQIYGQLHKQMTSFSFKTKNIQNSLWFY